MKTRFLFAASLVLLAAVVLVQAAFGHGVGYETLPPQMLGDRKVAMEVNSNVDNATGRKQITFAMFDTNTGITVRNVKYHIQTIKASTLIFEGTFDARNGILVFDLIPNGDKEIKVIKKSDDGFFGSLLGGGKGTIEASGDVFKHGGLYKFKIDILEAENYSKSKNAPVVFESGISFPETSVLEINDAYSGRQKIQAITYYETLDALNYDAKSKSIQFTMPFEWTVSNINQTSVIHQEVSIPKTFGSLQVSKYGATINGISLPDQLITVDDFGKDNRVIHLLVYQNELHKLYETQQGKDKIDFEIFPQVDDLLVVAATDNVQYKIAATTKPRHIYAGQDATLMFKIYDIFLSDKIVSTTFELRIESEGKLLYQTNGKSKDTKDEWNEITFSIPNDVADRLVLHFDNLGGNKLARAEIPLLISKNNNQVPSWIKNTASWWCGNSISDGDFLKGIEYLISKNVIKIQTTTQSDSGKTVPAWVKNSACWWSDGSVSDTEFINSIAFLVKNGIIKP
jgi:hypothetical protein